jgi:hypothetical protein
VGSRMAGGVDELLLPQSQVVAPQKTGKGPWAAAIIALEGLGPTVFVGCSQGRRAVRVRDHGCDCGLVVRVRAGRADGHAAADSADPVDGDGQGADGERLPAAEGDVPGRVCRFEAASRRVRSSFACRMTAASTR